jgi:hypothetical protein
MTDVEHGEAVETERPQDQAAADAASVVPAGAASTTNLPLAADGPDATSRLGRLVAWVADHPRAPLVLAMVLGILGRILIVVRSNAMIDGDEALVGIQAAHILQGERPFYLYGQVYMGSLEAYFAAALFRLFGPSAWALRAVPILLSPLLVYLTWRLARALLPKGARITPFLAGLAALFAALPPLYDATIELRAWGGQIEIYLITLALLVATVELAERLRAGASARELTRRWGILGFLAGLGIWINPLISYGLATAALWLLPVVLQTSFPAVWLRLPRRITGARATAATAPRDSRFGDAQPLLAAIPGAALGGLPAWIYAIQHQAGNLLVYVMQPSVSPAVSGAARHGRLFLGAAITAQYAICVSPRVLSGGLPEETALPWGPYRLILLLPPLLGIVGSAWLASRRTTATPLRAGLPLLYAGVLTAVFCLGTSAWPASQRCDYDLATRYAVPLVLVEPFLLLGLFAVPALWEHIRRWRGRPPTPDYAAYLRRGWSAALLVLALGGMLQVSSYFLFQQDRPFQSPYYRTISLDNSSLFAYLRAHNIHHAWCNHWIGNIVTFETQGQTTCADYYDLVVKGGINRPPGTLEAVTAADRPSFIILRTNPNPVLAQELDAQGIRYTLVVLPQAGVTVITPERTVDPSTVTDGLSADYGRN